MEPIYFSSKYRPYRSLGIILFAVLLLAGLVIRTYQIYNIPGGILNDEAVIMDNIKDAIEKDEITPYKKTYPHIENQHSLIQYFLPQLIDNEFDSYKIYALMSSLLLIVLFFIFIQILSKSTFLAMISTVFLLNNFWHIFYSRIFCTVSGILIYMTLSTFLFLQYLVNKREHWLLVLLIVVNIGGFFYYTSFRVLLFHQIIILLLFQKKARIPLKTIIVAFVSFIVCIGFILWVTDTSLNTMILRGTPNFTRIQAQPLSNIFYSLFLPFVKPPIQYSYYSDYFMGDPISYAFYFITDHFILGLAATIFLLVGIIGGFQKIYRMVKNELLLTIQQLPFVHFVSLTLFISIIVGIAGPSYSRLLPLSVSCAMIGAFGFVICLKYALKISRKIFLYPALIILVGLLLMLPVESANQLVAVESNSMASLIFHKNTTQLLNLMDKNQDYHAKNKYIFCPESFYICRYYLRKVPNLNLFLEPAISPWIISNLTQPLYIYWPKFPPYKSYYLKKRISFSLHFNHDSFLRDYSSKSIKKINKVMKEGKIIAYEIVLYQTKSNKIK